MLMALLPLAGWAETIDISTYTVTLSTATSVYNGSEITAPTVTNLTKGASTISTTDADFSIVGGWEDADGNAIVGLPKNAGTYTCKVQAATKGSDTYTGTATGTYTITKKAVTATAAIAASGVTSITFGSGLPVYKVTYAIADIVAADKTGTTIKDGVITGTVTYSTQKGGVEYVAGDGTKGAIGSYDIIPDLTGLTSANYSFTPVNGTLTVTAKDLPTAAIQAIADLTYDGTDQIASLTTTGTNPAIVVKDGDKTLVSGTDYSIVIASAKDATSNGVIKNAGKYWVTVTGQNNYNSAPAKNVYKQVTVNKKDLGISTVSGLKSEYSATAISLPLATYVTFDGLVAGDIDSSDPIPATTAYASGANLTVELWKDGAKVAAPQSAVGTYDVVVVGNKADDAMFTNYNPIYFQGGTYTVEQKALEFDVLSQSKKYGTTNPLDNAAGVTPTSDNEATYFDTTLPSAQILTGQSISVYPTLTVSGGKIVANLDNVKVVIPAAGTDPEVDVTSNYKITATDDATYTISKGQINVKPVDVNIAFGDAAPALAVTLVGVDAADKAAAETAILKAIKINESGKNINDDGSAGTGTATYPNAGVYTTTFDEIDLGTLADNYTVKTFDGNYTITKRELKSINPLAQTIAIATDVTAASAALAAPSEETITFVSKDGDTYTLTDTDKRILYEEIDAADGTNHGFFVTAGTTVTAKATLSNKIEIVALTNKLSNFKALATGKATLTIVEATRAAITLDRTATAAAKLPWKVIDDNKTKITDVNFGTRVLKAQAWNSFVLPFEISVADLSAAVGYAVVNILNESASTASNVKFQLTMGTIPANTPFLMKTAKEVDMADVTISGVQIIKAAASSVTVGSGDVKFIGIYETKAMASNNTFAVNGSWIKGNDETDASKQVKLAPLAAYVETPASAGAPTIYVEDIDGVVTAISTITAEGVAIEKNGWYTINGIKLESAPTEKGIYIRNGKKFVIK